MDGLLAPQPNMRSILWEAAHHETDGSGNCLGSLCGRWRETGTSPQQFSLPHKPSGWDNLLRHLKMTSVREMGPTCCAICESHLIHLSFLTYLLSSLFYILSHIILSWRNVVFISSVFSLCELYFWSIKMLLPSDAWSSSLTLEKLPLWLQFFGCFPKQRKKLAQFMQAFKSL